jgi:hypothetical protein
VLLLLKNQQVVQAFLPHTSGEAFADRIGSWCMNRRCENLNGTRGRHPSKTGSKFVIVITNQILGCLPIRGRFSQLLRDPDIGRRSCHAHMDHLPRLQCDEEERKERSKEEIGELQEVTGPDLSCVVVQKGCPLLASWPVCANSPHVLLNGSLADTKAQFQEFSANPLCTPEPIFLRHLSDQADGFRGYFRLMRRGL